MAIPKKKRRKIVVNDTTYYWRVNHHAVLAKNLDHKPDFLPLNELPEILYYTEVYIETGARPTRRIKAHFYDERVHSRRLRNLYLLVTPRIVNAIINHIVKNYDMNEKDVVISNARVLFEGVMEEVCKRENELGRTRYEAFRKAQSEHYYNMANQAMKNNQYYEAINHYYQAVAYDKTNPHKQEALHRSINDANENARLYNLRGFKYRQLALHKTLSDYSLALADVKKAISLDPDYAISYGTYAEICYDLEDMEGFYHYLEMAFQKGMKEKIDGNIHFLLKNEKRYLKLCENYNV